MTWDHGGSNSYRMGAEGKYDLRLVGTGLESESTTKNKNGSGVLTGRKSSSTPSLPDCTDVAMRGSVASSDQAASVDNLAAKVSKKKIQKKMLTFVRAIRRVSYWGVTMRLSAIINVTGS